VIAAAAATRSASASPGAVASSRAAGERGGEGLELVMAAAATRSASLVTRAVASSRAAGERGGEGLELVMATLVGELVTRRWASGGGGDLGRRARHPGGGRGRRASR